MKKQTSVLSAVSKVSSSNETNNPSKSHSVYCKQYMLHWPLFVLSAENKTEMNRHNVSPTRVLSDVQDMFFSWVHTKQRTGFKFRSIRVKAVCPLTTPRALPGAPPVCIQWYLAEWSGVMGWMTSCCSVQLANSRLCNKAHNELRQGRTVHSLNIAQSRLFRPYRDPCCITASRNHKT